MLTPTELTKVGFWMPRRRDAALGAEPPPPPPKSPQNFPVAAKSDLLPELW